jgi:hypothetical protein
MTPPADQSRAAYLTWFYAIKRSLDLTGRKIEVGRTIGTGLFKQGYTVNEAVNIILCHRLKRMEHNGERAREESEWTATCGCGWSESCRTKADTEDEWRMHVLRQKPAEA